MSKVRTVPLQKAVSGITLSVDPAWIIPKVRTASFTGSIVREIIFWALKINSAIMTIGSIVSCGFAPWPPFPYIVTLNSSGEAIIAPGLE